MHGEEGWKLQARMRGFHVTPSTQTFDDKMSLNMGGQEIRIASLLRSETSPEDAVVYLPSAKTLFLGELFDNQYFPRIGSRDVHRWIDVLRQLRAGTLTPTFPATAPREARRIWWISASFWNGSWPRWRCA